MQGLVRPGDVFRQNRSHCIEPQILQLYWTAMAFEILDYTGIQHRTTLRIGFGFVLRSQLSFSYQTFSFGVQCSRNVFQCNQMLSDPVNHKIPELYFVARYVRNTDTCISQMDHNLCITNLPRTLSSIQCIAQKENTLNKNTVCFENNKVWL